MREDFRGQGPKSQEGNQEAEEEEVAFSDQLSAFRDHPNAVLVNARS
jgi:hypothetical protein